VTAHRSPVFTGSPETHARELVKRASLARVPGFTSYKLARGVVGASLRDPDTTPSEREFLELVIVEIDRLEHPDRVEAVEPAQHPALDPQPVDAVRPSLLEHWRTVYASLTAWERKQLITWTAVFGTGSVVLTYVLTSAVI
jgi:hypothetical protein